MPNGSLFTYNPMSKVVLRKNNEIYVLNQSNGEVLQLTSNTLEDSSPIITKDSSKVVYVEKDTSGKRDIYLINSNGTDNVKLTDDTRDNYEPMLSDDGTKIIYTSKDRAFSNIYVMNLDGTNKLNLTNQTDKINKEASTFSNKIVYVSNDEIYQTVVYPRFFLQMGQR